MPLAAMLWRYAMAAGSGLAFCPISEHSALRADALDIKGGWSREYQEQFKQFDTILRDERLRSRTFVTGGREFLGREINYLGIGILAARYQHSEAYTSALVYGWNTLQYAANPRHGLYNLIQAGRGDYWARSGMNFYNSRDNSNTSAQGR